MQSIFPKSIWILLGVYFVGNLTHFIHNAEFVAFYPNLPNWLTRETVYLAWLGICAIGVLAVVAGIFGYQAAAAAFLALYGAFGLDGLAHYTLALCSEHTLVTNLTIWFEVSSGFVLFLASVLLFRRHVSRAERPYAGA